MVNRVKLGTVPVGPGLRILEVFRCEHGPDRWVELHENPAGKGYMSTDTFLLTASEARALAALLTQAAQDPEAQAVSHYDHPRNY